MLTFLLMIYVVPWPWRLHAAEVERVLCPKVKTRGARGSAHLNLEILSLAK